jgi:hypothetical protein
LQDGRGELTRLVVAGQSHEVKLPEKASWQGGPESGHAVQTQGSLCEFPAAGDFDATQAFTCTAWIKLAGNDSQGAIAARMDNAPAHRGWDFWVERRRVGMHLIHKWSDDAIKVVGRDQVPANQWTHVAVSYDGSQKAAGVTVFVNGRRQETQVQSDTLKNSIRTEVPFKIGQRNDSDPLSGGALADLRVYRRALTPREIDTLAKSSRYERIVAKPADQRSEQEQSDLFAWWLGALDEPSILLTAEVAKLEREQSDIKSRGTVAHVMNERNESAMAYVLFRGEYDKRRDPVNPGTPGILPPMPADAGKDRLGLARWLVSPEHPLTARVTVNRFWQEVFGTGLVATAGDFGVSGELPSHPDLLDWLAIEFQETGWDVKEFFRMVVTSNTYRQAATTTPEKLEKDAQNRLFSRGPRFRMDAEMIRDNALAVGGLLSNRIGGPSVKPYQPDGVWEAIAMNVSNTRSYVRDSGEGLYRRSLYTFWKRMAPPAAMEILNAPNREFCVVRRERTNTPLQALLTLNDPQFVEAARQLAQHTLRASGETDQRIDWLARRLLSRPWRADEAQVVRRSLQDLSDYYASHPEDARQLVAVGESPVDASLDVPTLAAWTMLANQLMNLDEVFCK